MIEQYQFVAVHHDRPATIAKALLDLLGLAPGKTLRLFTGVLGQATTKLVAPAVDQRHDITAPEVADYLDDAYRQQALAIIERIDGTVIEPELPAYFKHSGEPLFASRCRAALRSENGTRAT